MAKQVLGLLIGAILMASCGGDDEGGTHLSMALISPETTASTVYYLDANCASLDGQTFVGVIQDRCGDAFVVDPINNCDAYEMDFSRFGNAIDVTGSAFNADRPLQILNDCDGIISGKLNGEEGSCLLTSYASEPVCRCEVNTTVSPTTNNEAFASEITDGIFFLREKIDKARELILEGIADEANAAWDERNGPNFIIPCDAL